MITRPVEHKARFVIVVEAKDGQSGIHALRWLLKRLRDRALRCIDAYELYTSKTEISNEVADEFETLRDEIISARAEEWLGHDE
jgi:hypothetical protein